MIEKDLLDEKEVSFFALATAIIVHRRRIIGWMITGALIATVYVMTRPAAYTATASFVTQGNDAGRSSLTSLAGQFGVSVPPGNTSTSPELYVKLLKSRVLLQRTLRDTVVVQEMGGRRVAVLDLLRIPAAPLARREEAGARKLNSWVMASFVKTTGVVTVEVSTAWPSASLAIATQLIERINEFNQYTRQTQAAAERKFIERRWGLAAQELRQVEDRLEDFLRGNRESSSAPQLVTARERLQRDVMQKQQLYTSLTQALEDVRIREVRDTPVITVLEPPAVATMPQPQQRRLKVIAGLILGGLFGAMLTLIGDAMDRRRREGDLDIERFIETIVTAKDEILHSVQRRRGER